MTAIDLAVSRAVTQIRALEHALHSDCLWEITIGRTTAWAERLVHEHGVLFRAEFPSLEQGEYDATLRPREGAPVTSKRVDVPGGPFIFQWDLTLLSRAAA